MRTFCFRFDVDSHRCLRRGVPNLVRMATDLGVPLTFHVHMGRATRRRSALAALLRPAADAGVDHLPAMRKLGLADLGVLLALNPEIGAGTSLRGIVTSGHEVGLHGGRNHRVWQDHGAAWDAPAVQDELAWGRARLAESGVTGRLGFSSPAWQGSETTVRVAAGLGFSYVADVHDPDRSGVLPATAAMPLPRPVTNIVGEPGGVGFLEWHRARGASSDEVVADLDRRLDVAGELAVAYDHPFWAGIEDLALTRRLLERAIGQGFQVVTLADAVAAAS